MLIGWWNRTLFSSICLKMSPLLVRTVYDEMVATRTRLLSGVDCYVGTSIQPVTEAYLEAAKARGTDPLDLDPADGGFCGV